MFSVLEARNRLQELVGDERFIKGGISGFKFQVSSFRFRVSSFGFQVSGFRFQVSGFRFRVSSFRFQVSGFKFQVSSFRFRVSSFGFICFAKTSSAYFPYSGQLDIILEIIKPFMCFWYFKLYSIAKIPPHECPSK